MTGWNITFFFHRRQTSSFKPNLGFLAIVIRQFSGGYWDVHGTVGQYSHDMDAMGNQDSSWFHVTFFPCFDLVDQGLKQPSWTYLVLPKMPMLSSGGGPNLEGTLRDFGSQEKHFKKRTYVQKTVFFVTFIQMFCCKRSNHNQFFSNNMYYI